MASSEDRESQMVRGGDAGERIVPRSASSLGIRDQHWGGWREIRREREGDKGSTRFFCRLAPTYGNESASERSAGAGLSGSAIGGRAGEVGGVRARRVSLRERGVGSVCMGEGEKQVCVGDGGGGRGIIRARTTAWSGEAAASNAEGEGGRGRRTTVGEGGGAGRGGTKTLKDDLELDSRLQNDVDDLMFDMAVCDTRRRIHPGHSSSSSDDLMSDMAAAAAGKRADWCSEPEEGGGRARGGGRAGEGGRESDGGGGKGGVSGGGAEGRGVPSGGGGGRGLLLPSGGGDRGVPPVPRLHVDLCEVDQDQFH